jgi:hypothetical protein
MRDLEVASRKVAAMFDTDVVIVMGSQAVLNGWGAKAPDIMRQSAEIDLYPGNWKAWEEAERRRSNGDGVDVQASEYIFSVAGEGSSFDEINGFYLDGIDATSSPLPKDWQQRANYREYPAENGAVITTVSPAVEDTIASKLVRHAPKDVSFVAAAYDFRPFDVEDMKKRIASIEPFGQYTKEYLDACAEKANSFLDGLPKRQTVDPIGQLRKQLARMVPDMPDTHAAFYNLADASITVRKWDPDMGIYYKIDNPLGPAMIAKGFKYHLVDGVKMDEQTWSAHRDEYLAKEGARDLEPPPFALKP